jgi:photosystem II stability/assembly factor-like uncharacterized protein
MHLYAALNDRLLVVRAHRQRGDDSLDGVRSSVHLAGHSLESVATSPEAPDRAFVGTVDSGLQRSTDAGDTLEPVGEFEDRVTAVTVSPHDPDVIWAGTEPSAVYRSTDGGDTWVERPGLAELPSSDRWSFPPRPHTHHVRWLAVDPHDPERLYVAIEAGAFVHTTDGGETWIDHPEGARRDNHTVRTHPKAPGRVYSAAGDGYAESTDGGESWQHPQDGLEHRYVWGLAVDPGDPDTVVASAASGARTAHTPSRAESYVYRKRGDSWELAMDGLPEPNGTARAVLAAGAADSEVFALTNRGLFRTTDAAASWHRVGIEWPDDYWEQVGRGLAVVG